MSFKITANTVIDDTLSGYFDNLNVRGEVRQVTGYQGQVYGYSSGGEVPAVPTQYNIIERFPFASVTTNSSDVGDLSINRWLGAGNSSEFYGYVTNAFGSTSRFPFALSSTSDVSVGTLTVTRYGIGGQSSKDYGYVSGGIDTPSSTTVQNVIDRFPFAQDTVNSSDVGDLTVARYLAAAQSSTEYGYYSGGFTTVSVNIIDRFPFSAATGNAADVGDMLTAKLRVYGQSSYTHGYTSGADPSNVIERFPFAATTTNAADVGDLTVARGDASTQSSAAYGYTSGGYTAYSPAVVSSNVIDRFTFVTATGNAADVGDLTVARGYLMGNQY